MISLRTSDNKTIAPSGIVISKSPLLVTLEEGQPGHIPIPFAHDIVAALFAFLDYHDLDRPVIIFDAPLKISSFSALLQGSEWDLRFFLNKGTRQLTEMIKCADYLLVPSREFADYVHAKMACRVRVGRTEPL